MSKEGVSARQPARRPGIHAPKVARKGPPTADRPFAPGYGIVGAQAGMGLLPWSWLVRKMNRCRTFWLATIHAGQARPHVMPVWGVWVDDAFFFSTGHKSRKGQNLAANAACTVTNDDGKEAVIIEGQAGGGRRDARVGGGGLQEEVQDGSARHGRTHLHGATAQSLRIHREELSQVGDAMEVVRVSCFRSQNAQPYATRRISSMVWSSVCLPNFRVRERSSR